MTTWIARADGCTNFHGIDGNIIYGALLGVTNDSEAEVEVRNIHVEMSQGNSVRSGFGCGVQRIRRISSLTGGVSIPVSKSDTASASLPSQVVVVKNPTSIVLGDVLVSPGQAGGLGTDESMPNGRFGVGRWGAMGTWTRAVAALESVILREGEGVALYQEVAGGVHTQFVRATFKNATSGATYHVEASNVPVAEQGALIAVFNGSGSGIIIELESVESHDAGAQGDGTTTFPRQTYNQPGVRVLRCRALRGGETVTPRAFDPTASLPSGISARKNAVAEFGYDTPGTNNTPIVFNTDEYRTLWHQQCHSFVRGVNHSARELWGPNISGFPINVEGNRRILVDTPGALSGFVLKKGESIAVVYWFVAYDAFLTTRAFSESDGPLTRKNYNIAIEFNVSVGEGKKIATARPVDA